MNAQGIVRPAVAELYGLERCTPLDELYPSSQPSQDGTTPPTPRDRA